MSTLLELASISEVLTVLKGVHYRIDGTRPRVGGTFVGSVQELIGLEPSSLPEISGVDYRRADFRSKGHSSGVYGTQIRAQLERFRRCSQG